MRTGDTDLEVVANFEQFGPQPHMQPPGFSVMTQLGTGSCATVWGGTYKGMRVALKAGKNPHYINEVDMLRRFDHTNIVRILGCSVDEETKLSCICMQWQTGGDLYAAIAPDENGNSIVTPGNKGTVFAVLEGIGAALVFMHGLKIVHCDMKPENVTLTWKPKNPRNPHAARVIPTVVDLGFATEIDPDKPIHIHTGTPGYAAPEIIKAEKCTAAIDLYAYGVVCYNTVTGTMPVKEYTDDTETNFTVTMPPGAHAYAHATGDIIRDMMSALPGDRPSAEEVVTRLAIIREELVAAEQTHTPLQPRTNRPCVAHCKCISTPNKRPKLNECDP